MMTQFKDKYVKSFNRRDNVNLTLSCKNTHVYKEIVKIIRKNTALQTAIFYL